MTVQAQARTRFSALFWERVVAVAWLLTADYRSVQTALAANGGIIRWPHRAPMKCLGHHAIADAMAVTKFGFRAPALPATIMRLPAKNAPPSKLLPRQRQKQKPALNGCLIALLERLGAVINLVDPDVIVLGGGLSNIDLFYTRMPELWADYIFSDVINTRLVSINTAMPAEYAVQLGFGRVVDKNTMIGNNYYFFLSGSYQFYFFIVYFYSL